ncbi:hypothetical protein [Marinobacterium mangrovicola]|uniref:Uncharacterized protein n=1 Tax=Marinobacterium mangrovicola TaxID=1476959 RepID=A0A4R1G854_9GAMM|nr:hypothetical protein [Marinobacterium mangrovicola]TCK02665.1 hypothetical protein CLV83_4362 [Marinobacterium mangrovicola]
MAISSVQGYAPVSGAYGSMLGISAGSMEGERAAMAGRSAASVDRVQLSVEAQQLSRSESVYSMETAAGKREVDLDSYFSPAGEVTDLDSQLGSLLMPNPANLRALQDHISKVFPDFLSANGIPEAPQTIRYDDSGQLQLPDDYPYADQLTAALDENPAMARELHTAAGLASHVAALQSLEPFNEEAARAQSQAEMDALVDKYSYLFGADRSYPSIALHFSGEGALSIKADGESMLA